MDPAPSGQEIRLDIDPNAFQLALRDGRLTLVPRNNPAPVATPFPSLPLIQPTQVVDGVPNNQLVPMAVEVAREHALTTHFVAQNQILNEEQARFLKQRIQNMRDHADVYDRFVDQRRAITASSERALQSGQQAYATASAATTRVNQPLNQTRPSIATNIPLSFNQVGGASMATGSSGPTHYSPTYQQGLQHSNNGMNSRQNAPETIGYVGGFQNSTQPTQAPSTGVQFQQWQQPQQTAMSRTQPYAAGSSNQSYSYAQQLPQANERGFTQPSTSTTAQPGYQRTNHMRQGSDKSMTVNMQGSTSAYTNQGNTFGGSANFVTPAGNPNRNASTSSFQALQAQQMSYANMYYNPHPQSSSVSASLPTQAQTTTLPSSASRQAVKGNTLSQPQTSSAVPSSSFQARATQVQPSAATSTKAPKLQSNVGQNPPPIPLPQLTSPKAANPTRPVVQAPPILPLPPQHHPTTTTPVTVSPIKKQQGSVAKSLLSLFGKRKAPEVSPSGEPASKRRATTPRASSPAPTNTTHSTIQVPSSATGQEGLKEIPSSSFTTSEDVKKEDTMDLELSKLSETAPDISASVLPPASVLPLNVGELFTLPSLENSGLTHGATQPLFEVNLLSDANVNDSSLPRIEVLSDNASIPPPSRSPSAARQSSLPVNDEPTGVETLDKILRDVDTNNSEEAPQDNDQVPLTPAVARSPSEPLFLPLTSDDEGPEVPNASHKPKVTKWRPRRKFLYVQVPIPEGFPNPIRNGPRIERKRERERNKKATYIISSDEEKTGERMAVGPPRRALHDGYEEILRTEDAARLAPRSCEWLSCEATLDSLQKLEKHVGTAHIASLKETDKIYCRWRNCHMGHFRTRHELSNHVKKHLVSQRYCMHSDCDYSTRSAHLLTAHIREDHDDDMSSLKPLANESLSSPPIPVQSLPHVIPVLEAFGDLVAGHPNAHIDTRVPSPPATPQSLAIMPLSPTKHVHRTDDEKERVIDRYSFLDPFWPPMLVMAELSGYAADIFEAECSHLELSDTEQRAPSVDELLF